ncbi:hypothetical protein MO973_29360 [Paenibacillus sp. TRM 82003]|nr:hypothetical protein [Paenibacillus sp. TRM 82003]
MVVLRVQAGDIANSSLLEVVTTPVVALPAALLAAPRRRARVRRRPLQ